MASIALIYRMMIAELLTDQPEQVVAQRSNVALSRVKRPCF